MKTTEEIKAEIAFQEKEYDKIKGLLDGNSVSEMQRQNYLEVMSRHAARRQALRWVLQKR